jgi:hypothetical protein
MQGSQCLDRKARLHMVHQKTNQLKLQTTTPNLPRIVAISTSFGRRLYLPKKLQPLHQIHSCTARWRWRRPSSPSPKRPSPAPCSAPTLGLAPATTSSRCSPFSTQPSPSARPPMSRFEITCLIARLCLHDRWLKSVLLFSSPRAEIQALVTQQPGPLVGPPWPILQISGRPGLVVWGRQGCRPERQDRPDRLRQEETASHPLHLERHAIPPQVSDAPRTPPCE